MCYKKGRRAIDKKEYELELQRLARVNKEIDEQLQIATENTREARSQIRATKRSIWEDVGIGGDVHNFEKNVTITQYMEVLNRHGRDYDIHRQNQVKLKLLKKNPYFGRIDFYDQEYGVVEQIYLGVASLVDHRTNEHLVYDWRAPVSSMFYDYGIGPAEYQCPAGIIEGEILLKRQYKIEDGQLVYVFDSDLKIDDEILQGVLSKNADDKMRHIIYSIQREQNLAIRDEETQVLLVQGPAGSGKTSIALHRAAYLLYRFHETIKANNIVIFSPNEIFSDYISNVLPELGEENISQVTFLDYARWMLGKSWKIEDVYHQFEYLLAHNDNENDPRIQNIAFKSSKEYFQLLQAYLAYILKNNNQFSDVIAYDQVIITKEECEKLFYDTYQYLPTKARLDKIKRRIRYLMRPVRNQRVNELYNQRKDLPEHLGDSERDLKRLCLQQVREELRSVMDQINGMVAINVNEVYQELFKDPQMINRIVDRDQIPENWATICQLTTKMFAEQKLYYEDLAPFIYIKGHLNGWEIVPNIRHVIVDEAQDYSLFHYAILKESFPKCSFTILGDLNQAIHPYLRQTDYDDIAQIFVANATTKLITLTKSYRSTKEISAFTQGLLPKTQQIEIIEREGMKPQIKKYHLDPAEELRNAIEFCLEKQCKSIAVICKTAASAKEVEKLLRDKIELTRITNDDHSFQTGVVVIPVYLAKGLEFDGVIIHDADAKLYGDEKERNLFYTACTRALHYLFIYYSNVLTPFVTAIDEDLYDVQL